MKWFKHYSDMHRGRSMNDLLDQLGHTGLCFYLLQEMCAEKLEKDDQGLTESDCSFDFHTRVVRQNLRISAVNLVRLLDICAANGLLSFEFSGSSLKISMPILLNLLEKNTKKAQSTRKLQAQKGPLDIDIDKDIDKDKEEDKEKELELVCPQPISSVPDRPKKQVQKALIKFSENVSIEVKHALLVSWSDTYPKEYLDIEFKKARSWIIANDHKTPRSERGWATFLNSWLNRGWDQYRKSLESNPPKVTVEDLEEMLGKGFA